ncbi:MAG: hypothetical protein ACP5MI_01595 [Candidatus Kryptoniota bacterium]
MPKFTPELYNELKSKVCHDCYLSDSEGNCLVSQNKKCVLELYSTQIIKALDRAWGGTEKDFDVALRTEVCAICAYKSESGFCYVREAEDCPLNSLFAVISSTAVRLVQG